MATKIKYGWNSFTFAATIFLIAAAACIYLNYFDILAPEFVNGSFRQSVGKYFIVPVIMLITAQLAIGTTFAYLAINLLKQSANDALKAAAVSAFAMFLFSFTYFIFPFYGPYYYIVSWAAQGPHNALLIEVLWTALSIFSITMAFRKSFKIDWKACLVLAIFLLSMFMGLAS